MQQPMSAPPTLHQIDDAGALAEYQRVKESIGTGGLAGFLSIPGPTGQTKWDSSVPIGYEGVARVHICGPWAMDKPIYVVQQSHFYKAHSRPQGASITHVEGCQFCVACENAPAHMQEMAKDWKRIRSRYLYNVCWLDNLQAHYGSDGNLRALILQASKTLHTAIGDIFGQANGITNIVDYTNGRPVRVIKRKTGPRPMDIEWGANPALEKAPLPREFWGVASNLTDLEKVVKPPTPEDIAAALADLGLSAVTQVAVPQSFQPGANPPYPSPYGAPQQMALPMPPVQNLPPQQAPQIPQQAPQIPQQAPQIPQQVPQVPQMMGPPQIPGTGAVQQQIPTPPPISSGTVAPSGYQPQPSQPAGMVAQGQPEPVQQTVAPPVEPMQPQVLTLPLPPGTVLPKGRERCFGQYNAADNWCAECDGWIRQQCTGGANQSAPAPAINPELNALQNQLAGQ
jgi:hypothetical protein